MAAAITFLTLRLFPLEPAAAVLGPLFPVFALTAAAAAITQLATAVILALTHTDSPETTTGGRERE